MFTLNGIRNTLFSAIAFGIIACAAAPGPAEKPAVANSSSERTNDAQAPQAAQFASGEQAIPGRNATGAP